MRTFVVPCRALQKLWNNRNAFAIARNRKRSAAIGTYQQQSSEPHKKPSYLCIVERTRPKRSELSAKIQGERLPPDQLILYWSFTDPLLILYSAFAPTRKRHIMAPSLPGIAYIGNIGGRHHDACIGQGESSLTRLSNHSNMSHRLHGSHGFSCVTSYGFRATKIHFSSLVSLKKFNN